MLVSSTKDNIKKTADEKYTIESVDLVTVNRRGHLLYRAHRLIFKMNTNQAIKSITDASSVCHI